MKYLMSLCLCACTLTAIAQKTVLKYPFEFHKTFMDQGNYDAFFLNNGLSDKFAMVLKDYRNSAYVLLNDQFKTIDTFSRPSGGSWFKVNETHYTGGTSNGNVYNFVYTSHVVAPFYDGWKYRIETVDFDNRSIEVKDLFEMPKEEKPVASFSDNNVFYAITCNDKANQLVFRMLDGKGQLSSRNVEVHIPKEVNKKRDKVSEYLEKTNVVQAGLEPDFSQVTSSSKIFCQPGRMDIVVNESDLPTHLVSINLADFTVTEKFFDYKEVLSKEDKGNVYVNSYIRGNTLFSLVLNKKSIRVAAFDLVTAQLLGSQEINDDNYNAVVSQLAVTETHKGKKESEKDLENFKSVLKALNKGTEGLMVTVAKNGQYVISIGSYDRLTVPTGSSSGTWSTMPGRASGSTFGSEKRGGIYYTPGQVYYTSNDARYYTSTQFRVMLDPVTYKAKRGRAPLPVSDQIRNYLETMADKKTRATNQFNIGDKQYFGYYNRDLKAYLVLQIRVTN